MDDKPKIARATALLAANAFVLIRFMSYVEGRPELPGAIVLGVLLPATGLAFAYDMFERQERSFWHEFGAGLPVVLAMLFWMWWYAA